MKKRLKLKNKKLLIIAFIKFRPIANDQGPHLPWMKQLM